ncbi:MAG: response regulator transcription factor [Myxococcales bacterium]|nr:response regulator transcription factor [Myxococcales bacterium]
MHLVVWKIMGHRSMSEEHARILAVGDEPVARAAVIAALAGHDVVAAEDAAAAGARIEAGGIELVVLTGPDASGAPCRELKRQHGDGFLPVLIVTAADADARDRAFELGADDVVTAPPDVRELRRRVEALVRRQRQEAQPGPSSARPGSCARCRTSSRAASSTICADRWRGSMGSCGCSSATLRTPRPSR